MEQVESEFNDSLMKTNRFDKDYLISYYSDSLNNQDIADRVGNLRDDNGGVMGDIEEEFLSSAPQQDILSKSIEDVYSADITTAEIGPNKHTGLPDPTPPSEWAQNPNNWSGPVNITYHAGISPAEAEVSIHTVSDNGDTGFDNRDLAEVSISYKNSIGVEAEWEHEEENRSSYISWDWEENATYSASYEISGNFVSDDLAVDHESRGIQSLIEEDTWKEGYSVVDNFKDVETRAVRKTFDLSSTSVQSQEQELERKIEQSSHSIITENDFERAIPYSSDPDIHVKPRNEKELYEWVLSKLNQTHYEIITTVEPHQTDLWNMVEKPSPLDRVEGNIRQKEYQLVYQNTSVPYENTADLLRSEVRKRYFENTYNNIDLISGWHDETLGESSGVLNDLLGGFLDTSNDLLGGPMNFIDQMMDPETRPEDAQASLKNSPLMDDVKYQVEASPTYLSLETVNRTDIPAVRPKDGNTLGISNINETKHTPMGAGYLNSVGHPGFPLMPWPSLFYLQLDAYYLEVQGEYARFEVRSNSGDPTNTGEMAYVRQNLNVAIDTPPWAKADELAVGSVESISFDNTLVIPIVVPSPQLIAKGSPGVGDTWRYKKSNSPQEECTVGWNNTGPNPDTTNTNCISNGNLPANS
ncbi:hypothetical protein [Natrinema sp. H-ect4]|uniref:DUF7286 family protein n=1 Tax=Natrinema sp. H-ect4 TaxID=3242699 RepID=UPI0035A82AFD